MKKIIRTKGLDSVCDLCGRNFRHYSYSMCRDENFNQSIMLILDFYSPSQQNLGIFEGQCGTLLDQLLKGLNISTNDIVVTCAVKCKDHKVESIKELKAYHQELLQEIKSRMPHIKKIITFGKMAINTLINRTVSIKEIRQEPIKLDDSLTIYSTFSFFQVLNDPNVYQDILADVQKFISPEKLVEDTEIRINEQLHYITQFTEPFALDVETEGLNSFDDSKDLLSMSLSFAEGRSFVYDCNSKEDISQCFMRIFDLLKNHNLTMIGHNVKFDLMWLKNKFDAEIAVKLCDTLTMYIILDENSQENTLKYLASIYTTLPPNYNKGIDTANLNKLDFETLALYNGRDSDATLRLYNVLMKEIKSQGKENLLQFLNDALLTIAHIEYNGVLVDREWAKEKGDEILEEYKAIQDSYKKIFPNLNLNSPTQLNKILYQDLGLPIIKTTDKGSPSTDKDTLKILYEDHATTEIQQNFLQDLLTYSKAQKIYDTYFKALETYTKPTGQIHQSIIQSDGKVHTSYNLGRNATAKGSKGTVTGRLSSSDPNLQNIPRDKRVKGIFCAAPGYKFLDVDYSQLELRIGAWYSQEKKMYNLFNQGLDIHTSVLSEIVKRPYDELVAILSDDKHPEYKKLKDTRVIAKSINFGIFYGAGANTIQTQARQAGLKITKQQAQDMIDKWLKSYPAVAKWITKTQQSIRKHQEISSPTGRTRHLLGADRNDPLGYALIRQGVNFPIQTLASEVCLAALIMIEETLKLSNYDAKIVLTVHDSVLIEYNGKIDSKQLEKDVIYAMTSKVVHYFEYMFNFILDIPLEVSTTHSDRWQ